MRTPRRKQKLLNRNEVVQGPSPLVRRAMRTFDARKAPFYFEGYYGSSLVPELAKAFKLPTEQVSVGYGTEFFLRGLFDNLDPKHDAVLTQDIRFTYYPHYARSKGVRLADFRVIENDSHFAFDIKDCVAQIKKVRPKIVLITSPNNPTGHSISPTNLKKILAAADKKTLVVLDEAYQGFNSHYDEKGFLSLLKRNPNLVILRGFSKRYAMAGIRISFALWGKNAKKLARFEDLYLGGSRLLEHLALAALKSKPYYQKLAHEIQKDRDRLINAVRKMKHFKAYDSNANFVLVKAATKAVPVAKEILESLPVIISNFVLPDAMRVTIGYAPHTSEFIKELQKIDASIT